MNKKTIWIAGLLTVTVLLSIPIYHFIFIIQNETDVTIEAPQGFTNDASQLNLTRIDTIVQVLSDRKDIKDQLKNILKHARENNLKVSIAGAKHSMGGHTSYPDGIVLDMLPYNHMEVDTLNNILSIGSGALWEDAIRYLDKFGKSIAIMQAFSSFSIGGSISVNGHGWQKDLPPISSSVLSFTLMKADGEIINCSRDENEELFKAVIGGYGLFGIILDIKLHIVDNEALQYV